MTRRALLLLPLVTSSACAMIGDDDVDLGISSQGLVPAVTVPVTWQDTVGVSASGNNLTKTGAPPWNAGASSVETITTNGVMEFTTAESNTAKMAGLSFGNSNANYADIDFAIALRSDGRIAIYEGGVFRGIFGTYAAGDVFLIANVPSPGYTELTYKQLRVDGGGSVLYTSTLSPTTPLVVDTSLLTTGATINNVTLTNEGLHWQNVVGLEIMGTRLRKPGPPPWNAGASSIETVSGDGYITVRRPDMGTAKMFGLSDLDTTPNYSDIDFAIWMRSDGKFGVYESGVLKYLSNYGAGEFGQFTVRVTAGVVSYALDNHVFYTSTVTPTFPLRADSSFLTTGATIDLVDTAGFSP